MSQIVTYRDFDGPHCHPSKLPKYQDCLDNPGWRPYTSSIYIKADVDLGVGKGPGFLGAFGMTVARGVSNIAQWGMFAAIGNLFAGRFNAGSFWSNPTLNTNTGNFWTNPTLANARGTSIFGNPGGYAGGDVFAGSTFDLAHTYANPVTGGAPAKSEGADGKDGKAAGADDGSGKASGAGKDGKDGKVAGADGKDGKANQAGGANGAPKQGDGGTVTLKNAIKKDAHFTGANMTVQGFNTFSGNITAVGDNNKQGYPQTFTVKDSSIAGTNKYHTYVMEFVSSDNNKLIYKVKSVTDENGKSIMNAKTPDSERQYTFEMEGNNIMGRRNGNTPLTTLKLGNTSDVG